MKKSEIEKELTEPRAIAEIEYGLEDLERIFKRRCYREQSVLLQTYLKAAEEENYRKLIGYILKKKRQLASQFLKKSEPV